jgi:Protein of unknown function (DUF669)
MRINLTDIDDRSFEALPAGRYRVKISDYELKETKNDGKLPKGTPMINWEFTVVSDIKGDDKYANRKLWMNTVIHERTLFSLKALLRASGAYTDEDLAGELDFEPDEVLEAEVIAVVAQREYNGDMTNDVKRIKSLSDSDREDSASLLP